MTPGIHPKHVKMKTITIDPHPLSMTARGGKIIHNKTLKQPIYFFFKGLKNKFIIQR